MNMADALPTPQLTVIHSSINRPTQWLGGDRELIIVTALLSFGLALSLATWWGVVISIVFWLSAAAESQNTIEITTPHQVAKLKASPKLSNAVTIINSRSPPSH